MDKQYPTDEKIVFLACDAIRQEPGNKLSLLGTFFGGKLLVDVDAPVTLPTLAVLFHLDDGYGDFNTRIQIFRENNDILFDKELNVTKKQEQISSTIVISINSMTFKEFGTYVFRLKLDDREYERQILIDKVQS